MSQLRSIEWDACLLEPRSAPEVARRYRRETGRPDRTILYFADSPWLVDLLISFSLGLETRVALDPQLADLAGLVVSQDNSCRYCFAATRAFLRILGMPEQRIERVHQDILTADFGARERAALDFARRLSRSNPRLTAADLEALRAAGLDDLQIAELIGVVGLHLFFNRLATLSALPPWGMEELPDRWPVRLMRPLMALRLRRVRRRAALEPLRQEEKGGPFGPVIEGLDGLPLARIYRAAIQGMWESQALSRRAKALVLAVVGRALECPFSEQEGRRLALSEGLRACDFDDVLAHLASPTLDAVESVAVPFARETVWYQPARIQKRAREVMGALSREQFTELIAVVSLANALCRIGPVLAWLR